MKYSFFPLFAIGLMFPFLHIFAADETNTYRSVLKIQSYQYNATNNTYAVTQLGSAVAIGSGYLLTNAHVVFDETSNTPGGLYEVCRTIDFHKKPVCFSTANLIAYDESLDLALLKFKEPNDLPTSPFFTENSIRIGAKVIIYGYPGIGGDNISRTEGNIAGYEEPYYKIDASVDHGNSGGGTFNIYGQLLGIPTRVRSDNAVIGYMIPITTIRDFLDKKSQNLTLSTEKTPKDFKEYIRQNELSEKGTDALNDSNITTSSLKKYGLKLITKLLGSRTFYTFFTINNLRESSVGVACYRIGGALSNRDIDMRLSIDGIKKYNHTTKISKGKYDTYTIDTLESLIAKDTGDLINFYPSTNTCAASILSVNLKKDKRIIDQVVSFLLNEIRFKKSYPLTTGFETSIFKIATLPSGVSVRESAGYSGENSLEVGYFSQTAHTGETLSEIIQKKRDTRDTYFLGTNSLIDTSPSNPNLKPSDYSFDTFKKLYTDKYTGEYYSNTDVAIGTALSGQRYIIGTTDYKDTSLTIPRTVRMLFFSYPYMTNNNGKTEYRELQYSNTFDLDDTNAFMSLKEFFKNLTLIGTNPF